MEELSEDFFAQDTLVVARRLVGKVLRVGEIDARIVEVEAYKQDAASHARTRTRRSSLMFDTFGHVYVYFVYGMHCCLNITSGEGPGAVLVRSVIRDGSLVSGPGRVARALGVTLADNGLPLGGRFRLFDDGFSAKVRRTERIGITNDAHLPWRFVLEKE